MSVFKFSSREKNIFFVFLLVFIVFGVYLGIKCFTGVNSQNIEAEIAQASKQLDAQTRALRQVQVLTSQFAKDLESFPQKDSNEQVMSSILSEIETAVNGLQVKITQMKPQGVQQENVYNKFSVSLTIDGNIMETMRFIHTLQLPPHNLIVSEFYIEKSAITPDAVLVRMLMSRVLLS